MKGRRVLLVGALLTLATVLAVSLGSARDEAAAAGSPSLTGDWASVYSQNNGTARGDCTYSLIQTGNSLSHGNPVECEVGGVPSATNGQLTGTITGTSVTSSIDFTNPNPPPAMFTSSATGTVTKDGISGSGTWFIVGSMPLISGTYDTARLVATAIGDPTVSVAGGVTVHFDDVTVAGGTQVVPAPTTSGLLTPQFELLGQYYHVLTTAVYTTGPGAIEICLPYPDADSDGDVDGTGPPEVLEEHLQVVHMEGGLPVNRTTSRDITNNIICATTNSLSEFAIVYQPAAAFQIAFASERDGNSEIYKMDSDGSGQTRLTNHAAYDTQPAWSPDGTTIAFYSDRAGDGDVFAMNTDGTGVTNLTNAAGGDGHPDWSLDGTKIAFHATRDGNFEIYSMNANGSGQTNLTNNGAVDQDPQWSPDGTKVAFATNRDGNAEIYVMNADGTSQTRLTNNGAADTFPQWSPNGTKIAFTSERDGNQEIYTMNANGSSQTNISAQPSYPDEWPTWSPDGGQIAFHSLRGPDYEMYVMNADGTVQTNISSDPGFSDGSADWSRVSGIGADYDQDGCTDAKEAHSNQSLGGRRNPQNFWDFFDTPNPSNVRDKAVAGTDFFRLLARFNATGSTAIDPLSAPPAAPAYHTAFDRGPSGGPNGWNLTAANGSIAGSDFFALLVQFNHSCI